jgi:hypothetical protein
VRQDTVRSRAGHLGSLEEATFVPCPKPVGRYRHSRWQPKSHRRCENRRQLDLVADAVLLRKYCLRFTGSVPSLWNSVRNSASSHLDTNMSFMSILFFSFYLFFSVSSQTAAKTLQHPNCPTSWYILHRARARTLTDTWPNSVNSPARMCPCVLILTHTCPRP